MTAQVENKQEAPFSSKNATDINHNQTVDESHLLYYSAKNNM